MLDGIKKQIDVQHKALSSNLLITSVIEGTCENLTLHQTISIKDDARFCPLHYPLPSTICLCGKIGAKKLPLELPKKWELHHLKIQVW